MGGILFAVAISIGLPIVLFVYAWTQKKYIAFLLGVLTFVGSQILFRLPILAYLQTHSASYLMFNTMHPVIFAIVIGLSAGIVEELARFIMMSLFIKQGDWRSGFFFGAGHGGIEAVLLVGISALIMLFTQSDAIQQVDFIIGGIERFFAILLHIGLSIIVLQGVKQRKYFYIVIAIIIHGFIDALVGILPLFLSPNHALLAVEVALVITSVAVMIYSLFIKRRGVL